MQRATCHFSGHVQGVGFRYTVMNLAQRHDVVGFVRNLPDGRVELVMEGDTREREALLEEIRDRMEEYIRHVEVQTTAATGEFGEFRVAH